VKHFKNKPKLLLICHPMRHMPGCNMLACGFAMFLLVFEENVRPECFQKFAFIFSTEE